MSTSFQSSSNYDTIAYQDGSFIDGFKVHDTVSFDTKDYTAASSFNILLAQT